MVQQLIDIGTGQADGSGEPLPIGGTKINDNFTELYRTGPTISLDNEGVSPGNAPLTNQQAIANIVAKLKAAEIDVFTLTLNRAGTINVTQGDSGDYLTRYAAILLPSGCRFAMGQDTKLTLTTPAGGQDQKSYLIRNDDPINGNQNIEVSGGIIDHNWVSGQSDVDIIVAGQQGFYGTPIWWENITGLYEHDTHYINPGRWCSAQTKLKRSIFERIFFDNVHRDGFHFCAECFNITVRDISGTTGDNTIPILTRENQFQGQSGGYFQGQYNWADGTSVAGNMAGFLIENCELVNCQGPLVLTGQAGDYINDVTFRNITGSSITSYFFATKDYPLVGQGPTIRRLTLDNIHVKTRDAVGANDAAILFEQPAGTEDVTINNVSCENSIAVHLNGRDWKSVTLDNIKNTTSTRELIKFGGLSNFKGRSIQAGKLTCIQPSGLQFGIITGDNDLWDNFTINEYFHTGLTTEARAFYLRNDQHVHIKRGRFTCPKGGTTSACFTGVGYGRLSIEELQYDNHYYLANNRIKLNIGASGNIISDFTQPDIVTFDNTGNLILRTAHGYTNGQILRLGSSGTYEDPPGNNTYSKAILPQDTGPGPGLQSKTQYYVMSATTDSFQVTDRQGGTPSPSAIEFTDNGTGDTSQFYARVEPASIGRIFNDAVVSCSPKIITEPIHYNMMNEVIPPGGVTTKIVKTITLPRGSIVTSVAIRHHTAFVAAGATAITLEIRRKTPDTLLIGPEDVQAAPNAQAETSINSPLQPWGRAMNATFQVDIVANITGALLQDLTAGEAEIWVQWAQVGSTA